MEDINHSIRVAISDKFIFSKFEEMPSSTFKKQTVNQNQQLSFLRDWLLPMLMKGQETVAEAEEREEE